MAKPRTRRSHRGRVVPIASEQCRKCARCCKSFHLLIGERDDATRFARLKTRRIEVRELRRGKLWKVIFHYPCTKLSYRNNRYACTDYGRQCTSYRKEYPDNFLRPETLPEVLEDELKTCPALREHVRGLRRKRPSKR